MDSKLINITAKYSLITQVTTVIVDYLALRIEIPKRLLILKQLLTIELIVQLIETTFYIWLVSSPHTNKEITNIRYYDWLISTNLMLFTLIAYINHLYEPEKTLLQIYQENKQTIHSVLTLNTSMLFIGYLGELKKINIKQAVYVGFIPFLLYYNIIYQKYVKEEILVKKNISNSNKKEIKLLFWYFFIVWSIYGISALFSYVPKNISYNILDLFSKNFFGLFLSYKVYSNKLNYNK
jgi:bacteriorhodopsin